MKTNVRKLAGMLSAFAALSVALWGETNGRPGEAEIKYEGRLEYRAVLPPQGPGGLGARNQGGIPYVVYRIRTNGQELPGESTGVTEPDGNFRGDLPVFGPDFAGEECVFALRDSPHIRLKTVPVRNETCDFGLILPRP